MSGTPKLSDTSVILPFPPLPALVVRVGGGGGAPHQSAPGPVSSPPPFGSGPSSLDTLVPYATDGGFSHPLRSLAPFDPPPPPPPDQHFWRARPERSKISRRSSAPPRFDLERTGVDVVAPAAPSTSPRERRDEGYQTKVGGREDLDRDMVGLCGEQVCLVWVLTVVADRLRRRCWCRSRVFIVEGEGRRESAPCFRLVVRRPCAAQRTLEQDSPMQEWCAGAGVRGSMQEVKLDCWVPGRSVRGRQPASVSTYD